MIIAGSVLVIIALLTVAVFAARLNMKKLVTPTDQPQLKQAMLITGPTKYRLTVAGAVGVCGLALLAIAPRATDLDGFQKTSLSELRFKHSLRHRVEHTWRHKPGAYAIFEIDEISDPDTFKTLLPKAGPSAAEWGGEFIVRTDDIKEASGTPPKRFVVIGFDSLEEAEAWRDSPAQKEIAEILTKSTKFRQFVVPAITNHDAERTNSSEPCRPLDMSSLCKP